MKTCPQCKAVYEADYLFCLSDGNTLLDESGEQETVIANRGVFFETAAEPMFGCPKCGLANRLNSKFCKRCGGRLMGAHATPPTSEPHQPTAKSSKAPIFILMAAIVLGLSVVAAALIYTSQPESKQTEWSTTSTTGKPIPPTAPVNVAPARNVAAVKPAPSLIGRKGRLTTNQNIRSGSNKYSESLGVHYQDARIQILEETTFTNDDGSLAVWYRVRVLEDGCDRKTNMGCGNDLDGIKGEAAREGWMSAKHILLD